MLVISVAVLFAVVGLLIYGLSPPENPKLAEIGRLTFFAGMLALALQLGPLLFK